MRFCIISNEGNGLSLWRRLYDEGHEVLVWIVPRRIREIGRGIVPQTGSFEALCAYGFEKPETVFLFDLSGQGEKADMLRKRGCLVFGGGSFCDRLEQDRAWGEEIARNAGCITPQTLEYSTLSDSIKWLSTHDDGRGWYFKSNKYLGADATQGKKDAESMVRYLEFLKKKTGDNVKHILQEKLDGIDISTACYWNGVTWVGPFEGTIEHKKFMDGDLGPSTGCSNNVIWFWDGYPKICSELHWAELTDAFRKNQAPAGLYDINALVTRKDGKAKFLEWTPRFGYDSEPTAWRAIKQPIGEVFYNLVTGKLNRMPFDISEIQMAIRLSISPYPWENNDDNPPKKNCVDTPIWGIDGFHSGTFVAYGLGITDDDDIVCKDPNGLIGLAATSGVELTVMNEELLEYCADELDIAGLQYRSDSDKVLGKHIDELRSLGYKIPLIITPEGDD